MQDRVRARQPQTHHKLTNRKQALACDRRPLCRADGWLRAKTWRENRGFKTEVRYIPARSAALRHCAAGKFDIGQQCNGAGAQVGVAPRVQALDDMPVHCARCAAACSGGASTRFLSDPKRPVVAALITRLRSDLPGQITAQVTQARRRRSF
jgi:hypothetical protein